MLLSFGTSALTIVLSPCTSTSADIGSTVTFPSTVPSEPVPAYLSFTQISHEPAGRVISVASFLALKITAILLALSPFALLDIVYATTFESIPLINSILF